VQKECLDIVVRIRAAVRSYLWIACIACGASYTFAAPGDPDLSFNGTGSFGPFSFTSGATNPRAMTLQPDGKIVVAGHCEFSSTITNTDFCVLRLNRDGTVDTTFTGPSGTAQGFFTVSLGYSVERLSAVRLQSDGKIVLAGTCGSSGTTGVFCVARLNPNGSLDDTFDGPGGFGNGSFAISFGSGPGGDELIDMAIQPDDKIVVAGTCRPSTFPQFCVARLNGNNGSFDASFDGPNGGGNGRFTQSIVSTSTNEFLGALAIQANGAIVLGGGCGNETCMMRLVGSTGGFDPSFDGPSSPAGNGRWSENIGSNADQVRGIVEVLADGTTNPHLMIAFSNVTVIPPEYAVALLTSSGDLSPALTGSDALDGSAVRNVLELPIGGATRWIERANSRLVLYHQTPCSPASRPVSAPAGVLIAAASRCLRADL
jgi:uncharacterized delta-60 repeat protein